VRRFIALGVLVIALAACSVKVGSISGVPTDTPVPSGQIVFTQPSYSCAAGGNMFGYVAYLSDRANGSSITGTLARAAAGGAETALNETPIPTTSVDDRISNSNIAVSDMCADPLGPGTYIMRMIRPADSKLLASGQFVITP
jgi:hypothetical protein